MVSEREWLLRAAEKFLLLEELREERDYQHEFKGHSVVAFFHRMIVFDSFLIKRMIKCFFQIQ